MREIENQSSQFNQVHSGLFNGVEELIQGEIKKYTWSIVKPGKNEIIKFLNKYRVYIYTWCNYLKPIIFNWNYDITSAEISAGGEVEGWKGKLERRRGQSLEDQLTPVGDIMEELLKRVDEIKRADVPKFVDPHNAQNFYELCYLVGIHGYKRQYLSINTIEKRLRYARFMERHRKPIDFFNLELNQVLEHIDERIDEGASPSALRHEKKTLRMFLKAYGKWDKTWNENIDLPKEISSEDDRYVPFPKTVNKLYHAKYSNNEYENVLLQTIVFTGFNFGMRPPSELINLTLNDVVIYDDGTGFIRIHETKKKRKKRLIYPYNKSVLSSPVFRTVGNYIKCWRNKAANSSSGNKLFLRSDGTPITDYYLRDHITPVFKKICKDSSASLYTMRHTFATYTYDYTKDIKKTAKRLGHKKIDTVDTYIHIRDDIREQVGSKRNLFNQALRHVKKCSGGKPEKIDCLPKNGQSRHSSSVGEYGPAEI